MHPYAAQRCTMVQQASPLSASASRRLLVVEDDLDIQQTLLDVLTEEGFAVRVAGNGREALGVLADRAFRPDLILLDMMMPVMNGEQFRLAQRADVAVADIPVIVVSADNQAAKKAQAMQARACLAKPVDLGVLLDALDDFFATPAA